MTRGVQEASPSPEQRATSSSHPAHGVAGVPAGVTMHSLRDFTTVWAVQRAKLAWLLGAGASASAGVPLAASIRDRLLIDRYAAEQGIVRQSFDDADPAVLERVYKYFDAANGMPALNSASDYSAAFELCLPDAAARKAFLQEIIERVRPGYAQRTMGGLITSGACDLVITTNFDRLIEQGVRDAERAAADLMDLSERELNVAGLDSTSRAVVALQERRWPLVVKLHGDFREQRLMNVDDELRDQDARMRRFVIDTSRQFGLVITGYSGRDASVMGMLTQTLREPEAWPFGVWWIVRPGSLLPDSVSDLLQVGIDAGVAMHLVVAASFDETMASLSRQVVVAGPMREYFNKLHPVPRAAPAALPTKTRDWPVLRFNALPVVASDLEVTRVEIPAAWTRRDARRALTPRREWPVVLSGPGEVLCLGDPAAARARLVEYARRSRLADVGEAGVVSVAPLADGAERHHEALLLQLVAWSLQARLPISIMVDKRGSPDLVVTSPRQREPAALARMRRELNVAYGKTPLFGTLDRSYGRMKDGSSRRWAEKIELSFDRLGQRNWLLFTPYTWVSTPPPSDEHDVDDRTRALADPANAWRSEQWAQRRQNETWAAIIGAWSGLLAPDQPTVLTVPGTASRHESAGSITIGRTNAWSRPA